MVTCVHEDLVTARASGPMLRDIIQHSMLSDDAKVDGDGTAEIRRHSINGDAHKTAWMEGHVWSAAIDLGRLAPHLEADLCGEKKGPFAKARRKVIATPNFPLLYTTNISLHPVIYKIYVPFFLHTMLCQYPT